MTPASPAANSEEAGTGQTWFKIWEDSPVLENGQLVFPSQSMTQITFRIPPSLPSGQYLIRGEQIALHGKRFRWWSVRQHTHKQMHSLVASTYGGAQVGFMIPR